MSFTFKWPRFSEQFHADAIQMLDAALNKGNKPPVIADKIEVVELEMRWREVLEKLETGRRELEVIVDEGQERIKTIERAKEGKLNHL